MSTGCSKMDVFQQLAAQNNDHHIRQLELISKHSRGTRPVQVPAKISSLNGKVKPSTRPSIILSSNTPLSGVKSVRQSIKTMTIRPGLVLTSIKSQPDIWLVAGLQGCPWQMTKWHKNRIHGDATK